MNGSLTGLWAGEAVDGAVHQVGGVQGHCGIGVAGDDVGEGDNGRVAADADRRW